MPGWRGPRRRASGWGATVSAEIEAKVLAMRAEGGGQVKIAKTLGIGVSVVRRIIKLAAASTSGLFERT